jgi:hypothetical protein
MGKGNKRTISQAQRKRRYSKQQMHLDFNSLTEMRKPKQSKSRTIFKERRLNSKSWDITSTKQLTLKESLFKR